MKDIVIRAATAADIPGIAAIYAEAVTNGTATFDLDFLTTHRAAWGFFRDRRPEFYSALSSGRPA